MIAWDSGIFGIVLARPSDPKTNTGFQDPVRDGEKLTDLVCPQIHSFVSQLHRLGKLRPEQINQELWDLVDAVKHMTQQ